MKKVIALALSLFLLIMMLPGCVQNAQPDGKTSIVCTIFPQYDWVRQLLGDRADKFDLTLLLQSKTDLHNYQPSVDDLVKISACDLFIYVGGESDEWVEDALAQATNADMIAVNLLEALGGAAKEEEIKPGMEVEEEEGEDGEEEGVEYDEHVWLSLKNARVLCAAIAEALVKLDAANAEVYRANLAAYDGKLSALDAQYQATVETAQVKTLLFGDRFPFRYLVDDYGLDYHAAFVGCSAETEASFDTIVGLAKWVDELNLRTVMVTESADQSIARTIIENTAAKNQRILVLNAMQSVTAGDIQAGATYLSIMESNLAVLKQALK
jgi:zinc transport system substrate-binding protein